MATVFASASAAVADGSTASPALTTTPSWDPSPPLSADTSSGVHPSVKRSEITAEEKLRVLAWHRANGANQRQTAAHFRALGPQFKRLNQGTVSRWLLGEKRFKALVQSRQPRVIRAKRVKHPQVERCLALWLDRLPLDQYARLRAKEVKHAVRSVYECLQVPSSERLELSNGWLSRFQARHGLKLQKAQGEGAAATESCLQTERQRLREVVGHFLAAGGRTLDDVWNMDETSFFFDCSPVVAEQRQMETMEQVAQRLTVTLAMNATGSERLEPTVVGRRSLEAGDGKYYSNSTAWMTAEVFCEWLKAWNRDLEAAGRHVLLLVDEFRGHSVALAGLTNIQLEFFSPLLTEFVQPCSIGLSDIFHTNYRRLVVQRALERLRSKANGGDLFGIDQLEAIALANAAWQNVEGNAISASWMQAQCLAQQGDGLAVASSAAQMANLLTTKPLQELQEALNALETESRLQQLCLTLRDAASFVKLGLDDALGLNLSFAEIVTLSGVKEGAMDTDTVQTAPPAKRQAGSDPADVLNSLLIMESHWRATEMELPSTLLELLVRTREKLQLEFAARESKESKPLQA
jgi:transposase